AEEICRSVHEAGGPSGDEGEARFNFFVRMVKSIDDEEARVDEMYSRIKADLARKRDGLQWTLGNFAEDYVRRRLTGKSRSIKTMWGVAGFRRKPAILAVVDADAVLAACDRGELPPDCIRIKREVAKAALDAVYERLGEIPPGCEVRPASDKFYVK
ncbi:MAG TPA: host-nuclease inhibitor Gam family protein, partial [Lacipirellulaceae bacterium]|nr:host-nuclease inhibitor Gam family protein [Lacipirellulaceae bacterium]